MSATSFLHVIVLPCVIEFLEQTLDKQEVVDLAVTCNGILRILKPYIEDHFIFGRKMDKHACCKVYAPKNMRCRDKEMLFNHPSVLNVMSISCNEDHNLDSFPSHIIHLRDVNCDQPYADHLPPSLQTLDLRGGDYEWDKPLDNLPSSLKSLTIFKDGIDVHIDHLPACLTHLTLHRYWDAPLDHLPQSLTHLTISGAFNHPVDHLPPSLLYLNLGYYYFNQPVDHLPPSLLYLTFGETFNQRIDYLPSSLFYLTFTSSSEFYQPIDYLPSNLKSLILGHNYCKPLDHLPHSLTQLSLNHCNMKTPIDYLPPCLLSLDLGNCQARLQHYVEPPYTCSFEVQLNYLPGSLTHLYFASCFNEELHPTLPASITHIRFWDKFNHPVNYLLPPNLKHLTFQYSYHPSFNQNIDHLPYTLEYLEVGKSFNQPISCLPPNLTHLYLGNSFDHPLPRLPDSLTHLCIGDSFKHDIPSFPPNLRELTLSQNYPVKYDKNIFPCTLYYYPESIAIKTKNLQNKLENCIYK